MKKMKILLFIFATTTSILAQNEKETVTENLKEEKNISTFYTAVKTAGLEEFLNSQSTFTVFAANNSAFNKLPRGTVDGLMKKENNRQLQAVLTYHIVKENLSSEAIIKALENNKGKMNIKTLNGFKITVSLENGKIKLRDDNGNVATIVKSDIKASNGVIHEIDTVILPQLNR